MRLNYRHTYVLVFFHVFAYSLLLRCMSSASRMEVKNVIQYNCIALNWHIVFSLSTGVWHRSPRGHLRLLKATYLFLLPRRLIKSIFKLDKIYLE